MADLKREDLSSRELHIWDASRRAALADVHADLDELGCPPAEDWRRPAHRARGRSASPSPAAAAPSRAFNTTWEDCGEFSRLAVPGGWLVQGDGTFAPLVFVPDPGWSWTFAEEAP